MCGNNNLGLRGIFQKKLSLSFINKDVDNNGQWFTEGYQKPVDVKKKKTTVKEGIPVRLNEGT